MKMIIRPSTVGFLTYVRTFLTNLIWGHLFRKTRSNSDKCAVCEKKLIRRIEVSIERCDLDYEFEYCHFLCQKHALEIIQLFGKEVNK